MRVKIQGLVDRERFYKTLERMAEYLQASGIEEIQGINFYLTPIHPETGESALIVDSKTGQEVDTITIDNPTQKVVKRKSSQIKAVKNNESEASQKRGRKKAK
ncbi:MAG: hypothetical protein HC820_04865 [Hydrococcus sp. RM1_1_31]|nr:hypothetical protein [Hydrococcus sp. RM1_1_31]